MTIISVGYDTTVEALREGRQRTLWSRLRLFVRRTRLDQHVKYWVYEGLVDPEVDVLVVGIQSIETLSISKLVAGFDLVEIRKAGQ